MRCLLACVLVASACGDSDFVPDRALPGPCRAQIGSLGSATYEYEDERLVAYESGDREVTWTYETDGTLLVIEDRQPGTTTTWTFGADAVIREVTDDPPETYDPALRFFADPVEVDLRAKDWLLRRVDGECSYAGTRIDGRMTQTCGRSVEHFVYDEAGRLVRWEHDAGGTPLEWIYDGDGRLGRKTVLEGGGWLELFYERDEYGNLLALVTYDQAIDGNEIRTVYDYECWR